MPRMLFATKSVDALRADADAASGLKRALSATDLTMLGIGAIMGTGIFVVTGQAAASNAGPAVVLSFLIAGLAAALAALCYSEMAAMIPVAGSAYTYAYASLGELTAFLIGWDLILGYSVTVSLVSVGWSGYVVAFVRQVTGYSMPSEWTSPPYVWNEAAGQLQRTGGYVNLPAVLVVALLGSLLVLGVRESARINSVIVVIKVAVVLLFVATASRFIRPENWQPLIPPNEGTFGHFGFSGVLQAATIVFVSYIGFDAISVAAQETKRPQRDMPIGILASLGVCTALYIIVALVLTGVVSYRELAVPHPIAVGIAVTGQAWLESAVEVGAIAGLSSVVLVMLMAQPRIMMAMARDGLLPQVAAKVHPRFGTPHVTTFLSVVACAVFGGLLPIEVLGELVSISTLLAFVLVSLGVMALRLRRPDISRPFRVPFGPYVIPLASALISGMLIVTAKSISLQRLGIWMALGVVFYFAYCRHHSRLRQEIRAEELRKAA